MSLIDPPLLLCIYTGSVNEARDIFWFLFPVGSSAAQRQRSFTPKGKTRPKTPTRPRLAKRLYQKE